MKLHYYPVGKSFLEQLKYCPICGEKLREPVDDYDERGLVKIIGSKICPRHCIELFPVDEGRGFSSSEGGLDTE